MKAIFLCLLFFSHCLLCQGSNVWSRTPDETESDCLTPNCESLRVILYKNGEWTDGVEAFLSAEDCEREADLCALLGPLLTTTETETAEAQTESSAQGQTHCTLFSAWGTRVTSCVELAANDELFVVPEGRLFVLPLRSPGQRFTLHHLSTFVSHETPSSAPTPAPIALEAISLSPLVYRVHHFFSEEEARALIDTATEKLALQTTSNARTKKGGVERVYDSESDVAVSLRRRAFDLLGVFPFDESLSEGFEITRLSVSHGEAPHRDWIDPAAPFSSPLNASRFPHVPPSLLNREVLSEHDFASADRGTNRFASLVLVLRGAKKGGETVFPHARASTSDNGVCAQGTLTEECLDERKDSDQLLFEENEEMALTDVCRDRFTVQHLSLETLLFYDQKPNGQVDLSALHGTCPIMEGEQWLARLWVWNGPRLGTWKDGVRPVLSTVSASFESRDVIGARLFWEDQLWEILVPGHPLKVNTFTGHHWHVELDGELVAHWEIMPNQSSQRFVLRAEDLPIKYFAEPLDTVFAGGEEDYEDEL